MTRVMLEFLRSTVPVFEESLTALQTSGPPVHVVYDAMHLIILKLMRRFVQADQLKDEHDSALQSVSCQDIKDQLSDGELVIGDNTRKYFALLKPDKQKAALLGMRAFWVPAVSHLQAKFPSLTTDTDQRVDHYWNAVFLQTSVEGNGGYQLLPRLVKSCLVLAQANADSVRSLSVNARVVVKERSRLGEQTIVGLRLLKDAVKFHNLVNCKPEKIPVTKELRKSVRFAHSAYKARLDEEKEEKKKELEETKMN